MNRPFIVLELSGHIIDSLTLAKVIDKIQSFGLDYQVNDLHIGLRKHDISAAYLTLWADRPEELERAAEELSVYGAHPVPSSPVRTAACPGDGMLPPGAYLRLNPPIQVLSGEQWLPVERDGREYAVVIEPEGPRARLSRVADLRQGDRVVLAGEGIRVLPEA